MITHPHQERLLDSILDSTHVEPRDYQRRIVLRTWNELEHGARSVLIHSPTGSGKTVMGLLVARGLQQAKGLRIGWVAMRRNLLAQAHRENELKKLGVELVTFSMFDRKPPTDLDVIVVDEAQHDCCNSMMAIHGLIKPTFILGLSATPFRTDKLKLCFDKVIRDAGIHALIQDGYLSKFHHYTLPSFQPEEVAHAFLRDQKRWGKSIFYFRTIRDCMKAEKPLRDAGVPVEVVTGSSDRERQLQAFARNELRVLINAQVLVEGVDEPSIQTVFVRPSGCSSTIQMAGRVFRKHADHPCKQVVQCQNTRWPMTRTATAAAQFTWCEHQWRSLAEHEGLVSISQRTVHALAKINVTLPSFLEKPTRTRRDEVLQSIPEE
jgi:superfamily II DNA or RNA helicase